MNDAERRIILDTLRAAAVDAGLTNLRALMRADLSGLKIGPAGEVQGIHAVLAELRREHPELFAEPERAP